MEPAKANEFFCWLQCAKNEIITEPLNAQGVHILTGNLETCFGKNIVQRSIKDEGEAIKTARESNSLYVSGLKGIWNLLKLMSFSVGCNVLRMK